MWVTISPPINGRSTYWGNSLSDSNAPPTSHTFQAEELVTVCLTVPGASDGHKGFKATFSDSTSTIPSLVLGTVLKAASTSIKSPNYPSNYPANANQCWMQTPTSGNSIDLDFARFDVRLIYPF